MSQSERMEQWREGEREERRTEMEMEKLYQIEEVVGKVGRKNNSVVECIKETFAPSPWILHRQSTLSRNAQNSQRERERVKKRRDLKYPHQPHRAPRTFLIIIMSDNPNVELAPSLLAYFL
jgi:hypothetical protein